MEQDGTQIVVLKAPEENTFGKTQSVSRNHDPINQDSPQTL